MNKEEINKLQKELDKAINKKETLKGGLDDIYRKYYFDLQGRTDKAIEYINNLSNEPNVFGHYGIDGNCKKWLLNILKGENNE